MAPPAGWRNRYTLKARHGICPTAMLTVVGMSGVSGGQRNAVLRADAERLRRAVSGGCPKEVAAELRAQSRDVDDDEALGSREFQRGR